MEKEKIELAAKEYAKDKYGGENAKQWAIAQIHAGRDGFIDGARWRIDAAWHKADDKCETEREALVMFKNGHIVLFGDLRDLWTGGDDLWQDVDKFAYLDDLLPDVRKEAVQ